MSARMIKLAALYLVLGVTMGIVMGIAHEFVLAPVHAHINLLGFATLEIVGLVYHAYPAAAQTRLATAHFWIHNTALPVFMVGLGFALTGHDGFVPVTIVGALGVDDRLGLEVGGEVPAAAGLVVGRRAPRHDPPWEQAGELVDTVSGQFASDHRENVPWSREAGLEMPFCRSCGRISIL